MNQSEVVVSQHSRVMARTSPQQLVDQYHREKSALVAEKRSLELKLSDIEAEKRERALQITRRRLHGQAAIEATQQLEVDFNAKRRKVVECIASIDERLQGMKKRMRDKSAFENDNERVILLRIEQLLARMVAALEAR
jgi:hypothetical protein